jgi:hypothetical protein
MRTKALLLAAAFAAAGVATSVAQVYSVNAVGYVNVNLKPGFNLVSNPLDAASNVLGTLASNITGGVPDATRIFKFENASNSFVDAQYDSADNAYLGAAASRTVAPGEGFFIFVPGTAQKTLTFVGQVMQGTLSNPLPRGFSIRANQVPQAGKASTFGLPGQAGDRYFQWDATGQRYVDWQFDDADNAWLGPNNNTLPDLAVGEAFLLFRAQSAGTWNRTFSVNG